MQQFSAVRSKSVTFSGGLDVSAVDGVMTIDIGERPIAMENGDARISISTSMGEPLVAWNDDGAALAGVLSVRGGEISAMSAFDAQQTAQGWLFKRAG